MKFNLFTKNDHHFNVLKVSVHKEVKDSSYNSGLWILALVLVSVLGITGISLGLFSRLFKRK